MYILKNAFKCIGRAKGRNILIGVIVLVIAVSSCIGLSIRQAAESAKEETLDLMNVTATISFDRNAAMSQMSGSSGGRFDRDQFSIMMGASSSLTLEEYLVYAEAPSVKDFYYTMSIYVNGIEGLEPVSTEVEEETDESAEPASESSDQPIGNMGGFGGMMGG